MGGAVCAPRVARGGGCWGSRMGTAGSRGGGQSGSRTRAAWGARGYPGVRLCRDASGARQVPRASGMVTGLLSLGGAEVRGRRRLVGLGTVHAAPHVGSGPPWVSPSVRRRRLPPHRQSAWSFPAAPSWGQGVERGNSAPRGGSCPGTLSVCSPSAASLMPQGREVGARGGQTPTSGPVESPRRAPGPLRCPPRCLQPRTRGNTQGCRQGRQTENFSLSCVSTESFQGYALLLS